MSDGVKAINVIRPQSVTSEPQSASWVVDELSKTVKESNIARDDWTWYRVGHEGFRRQLIHVVGQTSRYGAYAD